MKNFKFNKFLPGILIALITFMALQSRIGIADTVIYGQSGQVSSFNGRKGAVMPQTGDYNASQVGAAPATSGTSMLKGNGAGGFSAASAGTDYAPVTSGTSLLLGNGSGGFSAYAAHSCTGSQFVNGVSATGGLTCGSVSGASGGTVTSVGLTMPAGFTVSGSPVTGSGTLSVSTALSGLLKGTGTGITTATSGTDYAPATSGTSMLKGNGAGGFSAASAGTDYAPATSGTSLLLGNGSGGFSAYAAHSCTGSQFVNGVSATGVLTCGSVSGSSGGTVTSVGLSMPSHFTVTGSPVTGAGTLAVTESAQACAGSGFVNGTDNNGNNTCATGVNYSGSQYYSPENSASTSIDWNNGNVQYLDLTSGGANTVTFANPKNGGRYLLMVMQGGTGSNTVTWPANVKWSGGTAPTLTSTAGKVDIITLVYDGVNSVYYAGSSLNY